jgi:hypothetical protein
MRRIRALLLLSFAALGGIALFVSRSDATPGTVRIVVPGTPTTRSRKASRAAICRIDKARMPPNQLHC